MSNKTKALQENVVKKISKQLPSDKGYSDISTTNEIALKKDEILKLIKKVKTESQYGSLNDSDRKIFNIVERSYEKAIQGRPLEIEDFILPKHEILELTITPNNQLARYIAYRYKYNQYNHLKIVEEYPPCVQIEPASICNFRCIMCYQVDKSFHYKSKGYMGYMSLDTFKKAIDELEGNVEAITLASRGEPLLNPQISEMLRYMQGKFIASKINTNASMLTEKLIHEILSAELQTIVFSVDASDKETYEKIRVFGNFDKVKSNIELFHKIKSKDYPNSKIITRISGVKLNDSQNLSDMMNMWKDLVDQVAFVNYAPWESAYDNNLNEIKSPCSELWSRMFVWWDGRMNPCDYDYKSALTNHIQTKFPEQSIANFWGSGFFNSLREKHLTSKRCDIEPCARCKSM